MFTSTFADIDFSFECKVSVLKQRSTVPGNFFNLFFKQIWLNEELKSGTFHLPKNGKYFIFLKLHMAATWYM